MHKTICQGFQRAAVWRFLSTKKGFKKTFQPVTPGSTSPFFSLPRLTATRRAAGDCGLSDGNARGPRLKPFPKVKKRQTKSFKNRKEKTPRKHKEFVQQFVWIRSSKLFQKQQNSFQKNTSASSLLSPPSFACCCWAVATWQPWGAGERFYCGVGGWLWFLIGFYKVFTVFLHVCSLFFTDLDEPNCKHWLERGSFRSTDQMGRGVRTGIRVLSTNLGVSEQNTRYPLSWSTAWMLSPTSETQKDQIYIFLKNCLKFWFCATIVVFALLLPEWRGNPVFYPDLCLNLVFIRSVQFLWFKYGPFFATWLLWHVHTACLWNEWMWHYVCLAYARMQLKFFLFWKTPGVSAPVRCWCYGKAQVWKEKAAALHIADRCAPWSLFQPFARGCAACFACRELLGLPGLRYMLSCADQLGSHNICICSLQPLFSNRCFRSFGDCGGYPRSTHWQSMSCWTYLCSV